MSLKSLFTDDYDDRDEEEDDDSEEIEWDWEKIQEGATLEKRKIKAIKRLKASGEY